jgi:phage FluMu gp28-like protein
MFKVPYKQQEEFLRLIIAKLPNFSKGAHDAGGNGGFLAEAMQVYGDRIEAIMLTEAWYREHTPHFKASLEDGDIENMPADQDVMEDHRAFVLINGVARIPAMGKSNSNNKDRHGDSGIAHLLADYAAKNPSAPIEFMPLPSREEMDRDADDWDRVLFRCRLLVVF